MDPMTAKVAVVALDQIFAWTLAYQKAQANPGMTEAEAEQLIKDTQIETTAISDNWRNARR